MAEKDVNTSEFAAGQEGRLNLDDHPLAFPKNDFSQCLNLTQTNIGGGNDWVFQPVNGNSFVFTLPTITAQDAIYQIVFSETPTAQTIQLDFENLNGSNFNPGVSASIVTTGNLATDTTSLISAINTAFTTWASDYGATVTVASSVAGTITIKIIVPSLTGFDYTIVPDPVYNTVPLSITCIQEAIDSTVTGQVFPIGNYTYPNGDLFIIGTTQQESPINYPVIGTSNSSGSIAVTIPANRTSTITAGSVISISGILGTTEANGVWTVASSTFSGGDTIIVLFNSTYSNAYVSGGAVTIYFEGLLNITVAQASPNRAATWGTTSLLTTKEVDARFYNPCRKFVVGTINNNITSLYWTDGSDYMRIFQYQGAYILNGAIVTTNPLGYYTYGGIDLATRNIINYASPVVTVSNVLYSGGSILSGNWRYTGYYLDYNLTPTSVGILSNPVNVYAQGSPSDVPAILGTPGAVSPMQVVLTIKDVPVGVYPYFQLIGINYVGDTEVAYLIKQVPVPAGASSFTVTHTGLEETISDYGGGFALPSISYNSAQAQTFSNNCLIYGNLTAAQIADFSAVAQATTHTINRNTNPSLTKGDGLMPAGDDVFGYTFGEYQDPLSTTNYVGFMFNECYRIWQAYELYDGTLTPLFWVDDILFNLHSTNQSNPFGNVNRRTANNVPNFDLSPNVDPVNPPAVNPYVIYPQFSNNTLDALIDGKPFNQIVKRIHFFVTDNTTNGLNEILACGLMVRHVSGTGYVAGHTTQNVFGQGGNGTNTYMFDNPFLMVNPMDNIYVAGTLPLLALGADNNTYANVFGQTTLKWQYAAWNALNSGQLTPSGSPATWAYSCSFYAPDEIYGQVGLSLETNDALLNFGQQAWAFNNGGTVVMDMSVYQNILATPTTYFGTEIRLSGANGIGGAYSFSTNALSYVQAVGDFSGLLTGLPNSEIYCGSSQSNSAPGSIARVWQTPHHVVLYTNNSRLDNTSRDLQGDEDIGLYYGQYYRPLAGTTGALGSINAAANASIYPNNIKFGAINTGTGIPTGFYIDVTPEVTSFANFSVYGGDTFTQKNFLKLLYPTYNTYDANTLGGGVTCVFVGQNRMNFNMRSPGVLAYPYTPSTSEWINNTTNFTEQDIYDVGYTPRNPDQTEDAYNSSTPYVSELGNREIVSSPRNEASLENFNRIFLPLSFTDLPADFGYITNIFTLQEELYSLQPRKYYKQNFQNRASLQADTASAQNEVILGSATQFSSPPFDIIEGGNSNNFGLLKGKGINGEDVVAWIDTLSRQVFVMSKNGIECVSLTKKMRSWFENNLTWVTKDNPHISDGITGVFDNKRKEFIWTIMAMQPGVLAWNPDTTYGSGDAAQKGLVDNTNIGQVYVSGINGNVDNDPALNLTQVALVDTTGFNPTDGVIDSLGNTGTIVAVALSTPTLMVGSTNFIKGTSFSGALTDTDTKATSPITSSNEVWQPTSITNPEFYTVYTIAYSLIKQSFLFYTPTPYEYIQWKETYLSFYPQPSYNGAYLADAGIQLTWFTYNGNSQTANALLTWIINDLPDISKSYLGVWFNSQNIPNYLLFTTPSCSSYLAYTDPQWVNMNNGDGYYNSIQYDTISDPNGSPQGISGNIYGKWATVQMTFIVGQVQYLYKAITKFKNMFRTPIN